MIDCSAWHWHWPEGSHDNLKPKYEGYYVCPKANTPAIPLIATIH